MTLQLMQVVLCGKCVSQVEVEVHIDNENCTVIVACTIM